jgi:hypothetical protein
MVRSAADAIRKPEMELNIKFDDDSLEIFFRIRIVENHCWVSFLCPWNEIKRTIGIICTN